MKINLIIPAAGQATRLRPLSNNQSKAMVRVNGKPCIDFILEKVSEEADIAEIIIVDGAFNDIREYTARRWSKLNISYVKQEILTGPRDAIQIGAMLLKDTSIPTVVWLGDAIILEEELPLGTDFLLTKKVSDHHNWCMWDVMHNIFYDKPNETRPNSVALVGLYSFYDTVRLMGALADSAGEYDISAALSNYGYKFEKIVTEQWYDIGEISSYYKTCASLLSLKSRVFNTITYDAELNLIHKQPDYHNIEAIQTIESERIWYRELDWRQQLFVPRFIDNNNALTLSYEPGMLLSDMLMYEDLPLSTWEYIIEKVFHVISTYFHHAGHRADRGRDSNVYTFSTNCKIIWVDKAEKRLSDTAFAYEVKDQVINYANEIYRKCMPAESMHGDLHFGNILYNAQNDKIALIDPRGEYGTLTGTMGDNMYDWSKLAQDLVLGYNHLLADIPYTRQEDIARIFKRMCKKYAVDYDLAVKGGVVLLATCIPLHSDNIMRQQRFEERVNEYFSDKTSFHSL
jgi:glucose-1-phosphate thymidylyltransferase